MTHDKIPKYALTNGVLQVALPKSPCNVRASLDAADRRTTPSAEMPPPVPLPVGGAGDGLQLPVVVLNGLPKSDTRERVMQRAGH